jgi:glycerophosphoryl diester phosphodiesterase
MSALGLDSPAANGFSENDAPMPPPVLLGHRGSRAARSVPENTVASFDLALSHGCDGFEFDVRRTADGRSVICHDGTFCDIEIAAAGAGQLQDLPTLELILARYAQSAFLDIEIKVASLERQVLYALDRYPPTRGYVVSSFFPDVLLSLRMLAPGLPLGLLCEHPSQLASWARLPVQFVIPHFTLVDQDLCGTVHAAGKKVFVWTVNGREAMLRMQRSGADGIISDNTKLLVAVLGGRATVGTRKGSAPSR